MIIGILTDVHEDRSGLQKAFRICEAEHCDEVACLGDIVGFCDRYQGKISQRDASQCLQAVKENCRWVIAGNHDLHAAGKLPVTMGTYHYPENWFGLSWEERRRIAGTRLWVYDDELPSNLRESEVEYIRTLEESMIIEADGHRILLSHFNFPNLSGAETDFPQWASEIAPHLDFIESKGCVLGITGHMHTEGLLVGHRRAKGALKKVLPAYQFKSYGTRGVSVRGTINAPPVISQNGKGGVTVLDTAQLTCSVIQIH